MHNLTVVLERAVNFAGLADELRAAFAERIAGASEADGVLLVHFVDAPSEADEAQVAAVVGAHNAEVLTPAQEAAADAEQAGRDFAPLIANRIQWHLANPATAGNAVQVLTRMQTEWVYLLRFMRRQVG